MLFITHDLELASAICDRVLVMYAGTIVETGPCVEVFERQLHPYTWGLLGAPVARPAGGDLEVIPGQPVSGLEAPAGCPFNPRCAGRPTVRRGPAAAGSARPGSRTACIRIGEIRDELR